MELLAGKVVQLVVSAPVGVEVGTFFELEATVEESDASSCSNLVLDGFEKSVDCAGECDPCAECPFSFTESINFSPAGLERWETLGVADFGSFYSSSACGSVATDRIEFALDFVAPTAGDCVIVLGPSEPAVDARQVILLEDICSLETVLLSCPPWGTKSGKRQ
ncbi:MAG: hypothetical protein ACJAYU_004712 [Bradymonadia bacterium]